MKLTKANLDFLDDLFEKLLSETDSDMIDLQDDDSCDDHLQFEKLVHNDDESDGGDGSDSIDNTSDAPSAESRDT